MLLYTFCVRNAATYSICSQRNAEILLFTVFEASDYVEMLLLTVLEAADNSLGSF